MNQLQYMQTQIRDLPIHPSEDEMETLVATYLTARARIEEFVNLQADTKSRVREIITATGLTQWQTMSGRVIVPADGTIVSYDAHALDALSVSNRSLGRNIRPHRRETFKAGGIRITPYER